VHVECGTLREGWAIGSASAVIQEPDDLSLVRLASEGDRSAFERLYREHVGRVYALCRRLTGNSAEAEDMTQEAFVRAWQKLSTFEGRSRFSSWLRRLAVNVVINARRAQGRSLALEPIAEGVPGHDPSGPVHPAGAGDDLEQAISGLPEGARFVFVLHDVQGYKHEEIAEMTGTAVGTSKAHLHRARKLLREALSR
jgi:RNA polymerase sigma-70 factor, ECF subfamily